MNVIRLRIKALRLEMLKYGLDAWYITGTDPHASEYLSPRWQTRAFISGFTGSYGVVIVTNEEAGLWTDSRYFLQAPGQLKGSGIKMYKLRVPGALPPELWLTKHLPYGSKVGIDPRTVSLSAYRKLNNNLSSSGISIVETPDLFNHIWSDRPEIPQNEIFEHAISYSGFSRKEKQDLVAQRLKNQKADFQILTSSDELAWVFNLRGSDVPYNPLFTAYGVIGRNKSYLFIDGVKVSAEIKNSLEKDNIKLFGYDEFYTWIKSLRNRAVFLDPSTTNLAIHKSLYPGNETIEGTSIVAILKAKKNNIELSGFREVMKKDGAALVEFLFWLKNNAVNGDITEFVVARKLDEFRSKQQGYRGESFAPVVGYNEHGAIVHFNVNAQNALPISAGGMLLFDSGGHYLDGTTDITRTVTLGGASMQQKNDYTLVLKGMIALTLAKFPVGTKGSNLDILARGALWKHGLNYGHGTGHGVGHYLNVHEGPASIRQEYNDIPISPGMVLSNEPGIYREGEYGIRIENMIVCVEKEKTAFGNFLGFETLTLCPIDLSLIDTSLLDNQEREWIDSYHRRVNEEIKPLLRNELHGFLDELTIEIHDGE